MSKKSKKEEKEFDMARHRLAGVPPMPKNYNAYKNYVEEEGRESDYVPRFLAPAPIVSKPARKPAVKRIQHQAPKESPYDRLYREKRAKELEKKRQQQQAKKTQSQNAPAKKFENVVKQLQSHMGKAQTIINRNKPIVAATQVDEIINSWKSQDISKKTVNKTRARINDPLLLKYFEDKLKELKGNEADKAQQFKNKLEQLKALWSSR